MFFRKIRNLRWQTSELQNITSQTCWDTLYAFTCVQCAVVDFHRPEKMFKTQIS